MLYYKVDNLTKFDKSKEDVRFDKPISSEKIVLNFNPYPTLKISGPDPYYLIELREFKKNEDQSLHIESYQISNGTGKWWKQFFDCPIEFYCDYEISIFKYIM